MLLYFDLDEFKITQGVGISAPLSNCTAKRGAGQQIAVCCVRAGRVAMLEPDEELYFVGKQVAKYDADPAVYANAFVYDSVSELYRTPISFINEVLDELFEVDGDPSNDEPSIQLMIELGHRASSSHAWNRSENYVVMDVHNNVGRDDDGAPDVNDPLSEAFISDRAIRHDREQNLSLAGVWTARANLKEVYDADKGGLIITLPDGSEAFIPLMQVPA